MVAGPWWRVPAALPGFLTWQLLWRARLTARGQLRCRRRGLSLRVISACTAGSAAVQSSGGKTRRPSRGPAGDA
jgi:hypothetical protein